MKTVAVLSDLNEAQLLRSMLESEGLTPFLPDENTIQMDWLLMNAVGGVRIQVPPDQVPAAQVVIDDFRHNQKKPLEIICPHCGGEQIRRDKTMRNMALALLVLFGIPIPWSFHLVCGNCGKKFPEPEN
jgi:hypothetical protein